MSWGPPNQPPPGQPPYGQPQGYPPQGQQQQWGPPQGQWGPQGGQPYGAPMPGAPFAPAPKKRSSGCLIAAIVGAVLLLGTIGAVAFFVNSATSGIAVPSDKEDYVGSWVGKGVALRIQKDGTINYTKREGSKKTNINGVKIKRFDGDSFVVNALVEVRFDVDDPPEKGEKFWTMTVDGTELRRRVGSDEVVDTLANVNCKGGEEGITCDVTHEGGPWDAKICFEYVVSCEAGGNLTGKGCEDLSPLESRAHKFKRTDLKGPEDCKASGAKVKDVTIDTTED